MPRSVKYTGSSSALSALPRTGSANASLMMALQLLDVAASAGRPTGELDGGREMTFTARSSFGNRLRR